MPVTHRYAAFISYASADAAFAHKLHRWLESYRIPAKLGAFTLTDHPKGKNRLYPCFRDREELPSGRIGEVIERALQDSNALIVVCSRKAAKSEWVAKEIAYFESLDRQSKVFAIIIDGVPNASEDGKPGKASPEEASPDDECFPAPLRRSAGASAEIIAGDVRAGKDGMRLATLKVIAGILGVNPGTLVDRDKAARLKRSLAYTAAAVAAAAALVCGVVYLGALTFAAQAKSVAAAIDEARDHGDTEAELRLAIIGLNMRDLSGHGDPMLILRARRALLDNPQYTATRVAGRDSVNAVLPAPQGTVAYIQLHDGRLIKEDYQHGNLLWTVDGTIGYDQSVALDYSGKTLVAIGDDGLKVIDTATGQVRRTIAVGIASPRRLELSADGSRAFIVGGDAANTVQVFDTVSGTLLSSVAIQQPLGGYRHLAPNGTYFVAQGAGSTDYYSAEGTLLLSTPRSATIRELQFSRDGRFLATVMADNTVIVTQMGATPQDLFSAKIGDAAFVRIAFDRQDTKVAIGWDTGGFQLGQPGKMAVSLRDLATGTELGHYQGAGPGPEEIAFPADTDRLFVADSNCARYLSIEAAGLMSSGVQWCPVGGIAGSSFNRQKWTDLTWNRDGVVTAWPYFNRARRLIYIDDGLPDAIDATSDGQRLAVTTTTGLIQVYDDKKNKLFDAKIDSGGYVDFTTLQIPGYVGVSGANGEMMVGEIGGSRQTVFGKVEREESNFLDVSDGRMLRASGTTLYEIRYDSGAEIARFPGQAGRVNSAHFACGGAQVVSADQGGDAYMWDAVTGAKRNQIHASGSELYDAVTDAACTQVLTVGVDAEARLYDIRTQALIRTLTGHNGSILKAYLSQDGQWAATASVDGTLRIWSVDTGWEIARFPLFAGTTATQPTFKWVEATRTLYAPAGGGYLAGWDVSALSLPQDDLLKRACAKRQQLGAREITGDDTARLHRQGVFAHKTLQDICPARSPAT